MVCICRELLLFLFCFMNERTDFKCHGLVCGVKKRVPKSTLARMDFPWLRGVLMERLEKKIMKASKNNKFRPCSNKVVTLYLLFLLQTR